MDLRRKQIDSLRELQLGMVEKTPNESYELYVPMGGQRLAFTIFLSADFPNTPPIIYVTPKVSHPIVDDRDNTLNVPSLRNWRVQVTLKSVISEALTEFSRRPPVFVMQPPGPFGMPSSKFPQPGGYQPAFPPSQGSSQPFMPYGAGAAGGGGGGGGHPLGPPPFRPVSGPPPSQQQPQQPPAQSAQQQLIGTLFVVPEQLREVESLSPADLKKTIDDPAEFMTFFENLQIVKDFNTKEQDLKTRNVALAQENLSKERDLQQLRDKLVAAHEKLAQLRTEYDAKIALMHEISQRFTPPAISMSLKIAVQEAEETANRTLATFMDAKNGMDADTFVKQFTAERKLHHARRIKEEQMSAGQLY
eukprot:m.75646 g.75646  ORF g.75646 m.75646 type:complete len:361 (+) comp14597_c0_seq1:235-1317(+)